MRPEHGTALTRRAFLRNACGCTGGLAALCLLPGLGACDRTEPFPGLVLALDDVPEGRSVHFDGEHPVELIRDRGQLTARSLFCTHQGCIVQWVEDARQYRCPCHEGLYDADGRPSMGPPPTPLRALQVRVEDGTVYVRTRTATEVA